MGKGTLVKEIEVTWPSGTVQRLGNVRADQLIPMREPEEKLERPKLIDQI
ncbi:MAG: ASPIC/UnbV domain-containing protein [Acidobacteriota bacterium]